MGSGDAMQRQGALLDSRVWAPPQSSGVTSLKNHSCCREKGPAGLEQSSGDPPAFGVRYRGAGNEGAVVTRDTRRRRLLLRPCRRGGRRGLTWGVGHRGCSCFPGWERCQIDQKPEVRARAGTLSLSAATPSPGGTGVKHLPSPTPHESESKLQMKGEPIFFHQAIYL